MQYQQIFIAGNDHFCFSGQCTSKNGIIIGIAANLLREFLRGNAFGEALILTDELFSRKTCAGDIVCMLGAMQYIVDLIEQFTAGIGSNDLGISQFKKLGADTRP